jgi:hypothetical protein
VAIGIDPLIDYAFKMLFGSDDHKSLTISLINTVLIGQPPVTDITFSNTVHLQIHFLQLNHLQVTANTLYSATPVERWCWFLRHAQELTTEQLALLLPDQEFSEAAKVLDMIAQTPEQLQEYNARLKAQRDEEARIIHARQQGIEVGEARGIEIGEARGIEIGEARGETRGLRRGLLQGQILQLQQLLCLPTSTDAEFAACDQDQLNQMLVRLQQRFKGEDV